MSKKENPGSLSLEQVAEIMRTRPSGDFVGGTDSDGNLRFTEVDESALPKEVQVLLNRSRFYAMLMEHPLFSEILGMLPTEDCSKCEKYEQCNNPLKQLR